MTKIYETEVAGRKLSLEFGKVAGLANGAVLVRYGDTVVVTAATASDKPRDGIDFFPLSIDYEEKMYAVGKIPGGFNKREGKASENAAGKETAAGGRVRIRSTGGYFAGILRSL